MTPDAIGRQMDEEFRAYFVQRVAGMLEGAQGSLGAIKIRLAEAVYDCVPMGVDTFITILPRTHMARDEILIRFESYPGGGEPIKPPRRYRFKHWLKRIRNGRK